MGKIMFHDQVYSSGTTTASGTMYDNTESGLEANNTQDAIDEIVNDMLHIEYDSEDEALIIPDNMMNYDAENEEITFLI